jgi:phosphoribosylformylglycinamidine synthase II
VQDPPITPELVAQHGITEDEYKRIEQILGRAPNYTELGIFSVMWSEHCSYKSSRVHLRNFPTSGPRVIQGPGENAGVIDIGDGWVAAFKMESHNHPSFIEPYQGAATGVGGILRDIFTMGARPIASLDSLRFGDLDAPRMKYLVDGVVRGISGYGNCIGIPTIGGETSFHSSYNGNILVNVFALGVARGEKIFKGTASGVGNPVIYVGSKTGRDGIHGATMASAEFDEASEEKRPTVQVGDPFTEKLLLEACLEIMDTDTIVGIQDMGAAGLTSSSFEMAGRAGTGIRMDLDRVPVREAGMTPYEIMLSESQERMLIVAKRGREEEVIRVFEKWDLNAAVVGEVTDDGFVRVFWHGAEAATIPVEPISTEAPVYTRPMSPPAQTYPTAVERQRVDDADISDTLLRLVASPNLCSKHWIYEQYDTTVRTNTLAGPERRDASIVRVKGTGRALAITSDVNPVYCFLDPYEGGKQAVAEAARNIAASGGRPVAITDCLNFGSPERPEIMWQFAEAIRGISEACRALETPVVSGNVSFYNETEGRAVNPTPTIGMVGILEHQDAGRGIAFNQINDAVILLGDTRDELGGSEWQQMFAPDALAQPPRVDLDRERALIALLLAADQNKLLHSAHDIANGGLAVALAESSIADYASGIGCHVDLGGHADDVDAVGLLFGESQARAIVSTNDAEAVLALAKSHGVPAMRIGHTAAGVFLVERNGVPLIRIAPQEIARVWRSAFALLLGGDTVDDVIRGVGEEAPEVIAH